MSEQMMGNILPLLVAISALAMVWIISRAALAAWRDWLDYKRHALAQRSECKPQEKAQPCTSTSRIEMADMKERLRKLEAIAAGVDL